jgi:DNA processing protein
MVPGVGPLLRRDLLECFETAEAVLDAAPSELRSVPGLGPKLSRAISTAKETIDVQAEIERCRQHGVDVIAQWQPEYPAQLAQIHDPPAVLFVRGQLLPQDAIAISIVGTRHATNYGRTQTKKLAGSLGRAGVTIVSGLARGIDAAAHEAALDVGARTLAVLGSGVLNIYPPEHGDLASQVIQSGAVLSENATTAKPSRGAFPRRNRIITGLSHGVIVVEAGDRSGALISARHAMEQGREVFAVPGRVDSRTSHGCHQLIRDGAKLVETADDVLEELGPLFQSAPDPAGREVRHPGELQLNDQERAVLDAVASDPTTIDDVIKGSGLPIHRVLSTMSVLEMRHLIRRLSGTQVIRV